MNFNQWGIVAVLLALLGLAQYSDSEWLAKVKRIPSVSDPGQRPYQTECIDGVEYLRLFNGNQGGLTGHFKLDGSLHICGDQ